MPNSQEIRKAVAKELPDSTPLYAAVGAGEVARERLAVLAVAVPLELQARLDQVRSDPQQVRRRVLGVVDEVRDRVAKTVGALSPTGVRDLPDKVQAAAFQQVGRAVEAAGKAREVYEELADRGRTTLGRPKVEETPEGTVVRVADDFRTGEQQAEPNGWDREFADRPEAGATDTTGPADTPDASPTPEATEAEQAATAARKAAARRSSAARSAAAKKAAAAKKTAPGPRATAPKRTAGGTAAAGGPSDNDPETPGTPPTDGGKPAT